MNPFEVLIKFILLDDHPQNAHILDSINIVTIILRFDSPNLLSAILIIKESLMVRRNLRFIQLFCNKYRIYIQRGDKNETSSNTSEHSSE